MKLRFLGALLCLALTPSVASADFRSDNSWMATTPRMQQALMRYQSFRGAETGWVSLRVSWVRCMGDATGAYSINRARGFYHHFRFCVAVLEGRQVEAIFQVWQLGPSDWNYRVTDLTLAHA